MNEDFRMGLLQDRHDAARDLDREETELVDDAWRRAWDAETDARAAEFDPEFAAAMDAADDAWADRGWVE